MVTLVQHIMGLGIGSLVYLTLLRLGIPRLWAAFAAAPVLLDGYVIATEQMLVSEPVFMLLVIGAVAILLWHGARPGLLAVVTAGMLLGLAAVTRIVGFPLIAVAVIALALRRVRWTILVALVVAAMLPIAVYAAGFDHRFHRINLTASTGIFLYGEAIEFVDCSRIPNEKALRQLCPTEPVGSRNQFFYVFDPNGPLAKSKLSMVQANDLAGRFALEAIRAQPGDYAALVWGRVVQTFQWDVGQYPVDNQFRVPEPMTDEARYAGYLYQNSDPGPIYQRNLVQALSRYQSVAWIPGFVCLLALLLAATALVVGKDPESRGLREAVLLTAGAGFLLMVLPAMTTILDGSVPRYRVPAIPLLSIAAAVSARMLVYRWQYHNRKRAVREDLTSFKARG
jgi:hypothetical protein